MFSSGPLTTRKMLRQRESSPLPSAYERGTKRPVDMYDTPESHKKRVRVERHHELSLAERRKLFEQRFAQQEAQKQQQQNREVAQTLLYNPMGYSVPQYSFTGYSTQGHTYPSNVNAGKMQLPAPYMGSMGLSVADEHLQVWDCSQQPVAPHQHNMPAQHQPAWH